MTATKQDLLQVKLEFGHKASCKNQATQDGFTHDWTVFVRGQDEKDISHFVEKVVFNLHESFPKPKRVIKDPPYRIDEQGYGSFILPIDVYFKNKEQPKTVQIEYDLFLPAKGTPPIHNKRTEALKFLNPPEEFKRKVLKAGGEMLSTNNGSISSPPSSNQTNINGNTGHSHSINNGKEMKNQAVNGETEKPKKTKPEKQVSKTSKPGNKGPNQTTTSLSGKRPSEDDEILPKVKKKKKKLVEDKDGPQSVHTKSTGFIPIEPPGTGVEEEHTLGNNKDVKLKIKTLSKTSKKTEKATDKSIAKVKQKKKEKPSDGADTSNCVKNVNSSINNTVNGESKKKASNGSKSIEKTSKSPKESKPKPSKQEEKSPKESKPKTSKQEDRKVEKLMFRRESGDSWSSSTSSNSPSLQMLNSGYNKSNPLGALMAELSDPDDDEDDEDIDISTPFRNDPLTPKSDCFPLSNNNIPSGKDSKPSKAKTKMKEKKESKSSSSKNGALKSPTISSKTESTKSSSKLSSKTKIKTTKNGSNGHQMARTDLLHLYKELSSITDSDRLQQVADIIEHSSCFVITETNLEFDLNILDITTLQKIQKCIKR